MKLDLIRFFKEIEGESYAVIKPSNALPDYQVGSDIDIFCYHSDRMVEKVTVFLSSYIGPASKVKITNNEDNAHIDYVIKGKLEFRFDVYRSLPEYKNINLKAAFYSSVIESARDLTLSRGGECQTVRIPAPIDDFILRYAEYHEYFFQRPDKIKHIEYIQGKLATGDIILEQALDKLHYYTSFPRPEYGKKSVKGRVAENIGYYRSLMLKIKHLYVTEGLKALLLKIFRKIKG